MTPKDLKEVQLALDVSEPKLADLLGCSYSLANKMLSGARTITPQTKLMIIKAIDLKIKSNNSNNIVLQTLHNKLS